MHKYTCYGKPDLISPSCFIRKNHETSMTGTYRNRMVFSSTKAKWLKNDLSTKDQRHTFWYMFVLNSNSKWYINSNCSKHVTKTKIVHHKGDAKTIMVTIIKVNVLVLVCLVRVQILLLSCFNFGKYITKFT